MSMQCMQYIIPAHLAVVSSASIDRCAYLVQVVCLENDKPVCVNLGSCEPLVMGLQLQQLTL